MCGELKDAVRDYLRFKAEQEAAHAEWRDNDARRLRDRVKEAEARMTALAFAP